MRLTISGSASELTRFMQLAETAGCKIESTAASADDRRDGRYRESEPSNKRMDCISAQWHIWNRIGRYPYGAAHLVKKLGCEYQMNTLGKLLDFHNPNPAITRWQIEVLANELGISPDVVLTAFNCPKYEPHSNTEW